MIAPTPFPGLCDDQNQMQACGYAEESVTCVDGHWVDCVTGASHGAACREGAPAAEGSLCCLNDYRPSGVAGGGPDRGCCVGGVFVTCVDFYVRYADAGCDAAGE
jgi:hypothetical protein